MERNSTSNGPIFVVGMNGSGTTVLLDHLNSHSRIYGFPEETRILPYFIQSAERYGSLSDPSNRHRMWTEICSSFPFWTANGEQPLLLPEDWQNLANKPSEVFDYIMSEFARRQGKSIWCEKTPMHANHIALLAYEYPDARFVHIIRDGRDCSYSFSRRWHYDPYVTIFRWKNTVRNAREQGRSAAAGRYTEVRFERLTTEPEKTLRGLCGFLDIEFEEEMLMTRRTSGRVRGISSKRLVPNSGAFRNYFSEQQISRLENIAGSLLAELGYPTNDPSGDASLPRIYVWIKQSSTQFRKFRDIIHRAKRSRRPVRLLFSRIITGIRYRRTSQ